MTSIFDDDLTTWDPDDLDMSGQPGQRSYNSSAGTSIQDITDAQLIDSRLMSATSIGQFSRLTEVDPDMSQIIWDYASDFSISNEEFFNQILDLHQINGMGQLVKDFQSIDNATLEKMRWVQTPQLFKDFMLAGGYQTRDLRDATSGKGKSLMEQFFSLSWLGDDIEDSIGKVTGAVGTPIRWAGRTTWGSLEDSQDFLSHQFRAYLIAQEDTRIWDPTWLNPAKYYGKGGFLDRTDDAPTTWSAEDIDKINDAFPDDTRRWLARETLGYGDFTGRIADLVDEQFKEEGIVPDQFTPEWGERFFEYYDLINTQEWAELYNTMGAGAYAGAPPGSMESLILKDWNNSAQFNWQKMKPGSAAAQIYSGTLGMIYRIAYDPYNIAFMGVGAGAQVGVVAGKAMLNQTDDMVRLLRMTNAVDESGDVLKLKDTWRVGDDGIFTAEQLGLEVGQTVKVKDLVRAVRKQAEHAQYGETIVNAAKGTTRPTTAQVATALKYGRFGYLATPQTVRDVLFLRKIRQIGGTLDWLSKSYKYHFALKSGIEALMKLENIDYQTARAQVLKTIEDLEGAGVAAEYSTAFRNLNNINPGIRRLLPAMQKWHIEQLEAGLEGFGTYDRMLDFLEQNLGEVLAHTNQLSPRGFKFPTVSARQRFMGRAKIGGLDASNKGRNLTPQQMDDLLGHGVSVMKRRIDDTAEELARAVEQNFDVSPAALADDGVITPLDDILARLNDEQRSMLREVFSDPESRTVQMIRELVRTRGVAPVPMGQEAKVRIIDQVLRRNYKTNIKFAEGVNTDKRLKVLSRFIDELLEVTLNNLKKEFEINDIYSLSNKPDGLGKLSRYGRAGRAFVKSPLRAFGILLRNARYAPKGGPVALDTVGGYENMMRYFDMGYLAHLPDEVIEYYQIKYLYGTPGERLNIVTEFISDFLSNSGLLSITDPSIERMYMTWVKRMEHAYGVSGADAVNVMEDTNRAVFKSEMAEQMLLPDIHEMMKASRHLGWWRRIGISPSADFVNSQIGTYWKPAVLIRMGFIPKTAGEEAFSFILRNGIPDYLAAKLGPRGASLYKTWDSSTGKRIWYDGKNLQQLERYRRANPMKPILWFLRSFGPREVALRKVIARQLIEEYGQAWVKLSEAQQQDLIYKRLSMLLANATDVPLKGKQNFHRMYVYNVNMFDEWARQKHRWVWERYNEIFNGRNRSYNTVRPSTPNVTNPKRTTGTFTDRVTDPDTGIQYDLPPDAWVKAKQRTDRLAEKVATNLVGPEHVEYLIKAARIWMLHPTARNASANVMASTVSKAYSGETAAEQIARESIDAINGYSPDHVHLSLGYDRHIFETLPNPAQGGLGDTSPMLGADFPRATYIIGWRIHDDPASLAAAKVLLNANPVEQGRNARNLVRFISGSDKAGADNAQFYQMFVRELDYLPFDVKSILSQAHKRSHNGHGWDVGADLVAPHTAHEAKLLSKEERMRRAMSDRDYNEARRVGAEIEAGHEWNWLDDLSDEEFAVYERINYIFSQATDWDPSIVERIQLGEALAYEELFTMPSENALVQMFTDDMLARPLDQWIDIYKSLGRDRVLTPREANAMNLAHWTMFPQTSRYGVHRYIPVKPLAGLDKSAPLPGIGSNTKWVPAAEGTADGALDSIRTGNTFLHTGDTLVPELPVPRLDIFRNDLDGQDILNGVLAGNKEQRLMLYNISDMDMSILTSVGDDPTLLRAYAQEAAYSKLIQPMYSSQIDDSARMSRAVEQGRPADHTSLYVPVIRTEIVESLVATLQNPEVSIEFAEFLVTKLMAIPNKRKSLSTAIPIGELSDPKYARLLADEIVDLLNPLNDPVGGGLGPEIYSTIADDALEMMSLVDETNGVYFPTMIMLTDPDIARVVSEAITEFASVKQMGKTGISFRETPALNFARVDVHTNAFTGKTKMHLPEENTVLGIPDGTEIQITDDVVAEIQGFNRDINPNYRHDPYAPNNHPLYRPPNIGVYGTSHRSERIWPASPWEGEGFATRPVYGTSDMGSLNLHPVTNETKEYIEITVRSGPNKGARKTISQDEYMIYLEEWPTVRAMTSDDFKAEILYPHDLDPTGKPYGMSKMGMNSLRADALPTDPIPIFINFDAILGWANRRIVTQGADSYSSIAVQALQEMGIDPNMMFAYLSSPTTKIIAGQLSFADEFIEIANKWLKNLYGDDVTLLTTSSRLEDSLAEAAFIWEHEIAHARLNHVRKERRLNPVEELTVTGVKEQMANSMALKKLGIPDEALSMNPEEIMYMHPDDWDWVETGRFLGTGATQDEYIRAGAMGKVDAVWNHSTKPLRSGQAIDTTTIGDLSWPLIDNVLDPDIARFNMTARLDDMPWQAHGPRAVISSEGMFQKIVNGFFEGIASPLINAVIREPLFLENFALALRETDFIRRTFQHSPTAFKNLKKAKGIVGQTIHIDDIGQVRSEKLEEIITHGMMNPEQMPDVIHVGLHDMTATGTITNPTEPNYMKKLVVAIMNNDRKEVAKYLEPAIEQHVFKNFNPSSLGKEITDDFMLVVDDFMDWSWHETHLINEQIKVASSNAVGKTIPWIDDHTLRPFFQEVVGNLLPFWFAHEQFLRRMARGLVTSPQMFRNLEVGITVGGNTGFIREDSFGEKRLYMPVLPTVAKLVHGGWDGISNVAGDMTIPQVEAAMLWAGDELIQPWEQPIGWPMKSMLPGWDPNKVHMPGVGPMVSVPLVGISMMLPEFAPVFDDLTYFRYSGSTAVDQNSALASMLNTLVGVGFVKHVIPAGMSSIGMTEGPFGMKDAGEALTAGAVLMNMLGELPDEETYYLDKAEYQEGVRQHARNILNMRAFTWFWGPGAAQMEPLIGDEPLRFSREFQDMLDVASRTGVLGWEEIYAELYERYVNDAKAEHGEDWKLHAPPHRFQLFVTGKQTTTATGAPLPPTESALEYINDNEQFITNYKYGASYLVPADWTKDEEYSSLSAQRMVALDLRRRIGWDDLIEDWYMGADLQEYHMRTGEMDRIILDNDYKIKRKGIYRGERYTAEEIKRFSEIIKKTKAEKEAFVEAFTNTHPIFAYGKSNPAHAEGRRARTIADFKVMLNAYDEDPDLIPESEHRDDILEFARILVTLSETMDSLRNRQGGTELRKQARRKAVDDMETFRRGKPWVNSLYYTVGRPLIGEDEYLKIEFDPYYGEVN